MPFIKFTDHFGYPKEVPFSVINCHWCTGGNPIGGWTLKEAIANAIQAGYEQDACGNWTCPECKELKP